MMDERLRSETKRRHGPDCGCPVCGVTAAEALGHAEKVALGYHPDQDVRMTYVNSFLCSVPNGSEARHALCGTKFTSVSGARVNINMCGCNCHKGGRS